jgi:hypothetical protein
MPKRDTAIDISRVTPSKELFHNERINVYHIRVPFELIQFWPENFRTVLAFDLLEAEAGKALSKITLEEITDFLSERPELRIPELAESIEKNGVRVPLIILDDGTLLDGNRRFFACSYLLHKAQRKDQPRSSILDDIPVWVIKDSDISERTRYKILAEANYVKDMKLAWTLDVKAMVIYDYFQASIKRGRMTEAQAYEEIFDVFGEERSAVDAYIESVDLAKEFIDSAPESKTNKFRELVQGKFLYFWEFRNKALKGRAALDSTRELPKVKRLFFKMIETDRFNNFKQVEPMIRSIRDEYSWELLSNSQGAKIDQVEALYKEQKAIRSAEDKIRNFLKWLQGKVEPGTFTKATITLLGELRDEIKLLLGKLK